MGCYCGCATKANKIKWGLSAVFFLIAAVCLPLFIVYDMTYVDAQNDCIDHKLHCDWYNDGARYRYQCDPDYCSNKYRDKYHLAIIFFLIFILFAIVTTIPLCIMCCCTDKPVCIDTQPAIGMVTYTAEV